MNKNLHNLYEFKMDYIKTKHFVKEKNVIQYSIYDCYPVRSY